MLKRVAAGLVVVASIAGFGLPPSPASAGTGHRVEAYLTSQLGDYVGQGKAIAYSTPGHDAFVNANPGSVVVSLSAPGAFLTAIFGSDRGQPLTTGIYGDARRQYGPGHPRLDVVANGAGCNNTSGWFEILEISYNGPDIASLAVDFEQHCEFEEPALFGSIRVNSSVPIDWAQLDALAAPSFFDLHPSSCPQLTDSVYRLYTAYFLREPDTTGWNYWLDVYGRTPASLETISWSFAASDEFRLRYGSLNNRDFVRLVYANVLDRAPDPVGWDHWTNALNRGYGRGAVMLAFSESAEYTNLTGTAAPMAGYLQWYTAPVTFRCGAGNGRVGTAGAGYLDLMVVNESVRNTLGYQVVLDAGAVRYETEPDALAPTELVLLWNQPLARLRIGTASIEVANNSEMHWAAVLYGHPHSATRSPYSDGLAAAQLTVG